MSDARVLAIVHDADAGPGVFADAVAARGARLEHWDIARGAPAPGDPGDYDAVISFGGAAHPDQEAAHPWLRAEKDVLRDLLERGTPLLGVCLGAQLLAEAAGGTAGPMRRPEVGWVRVRVSEAGAGDPLIGPLAPEFEALEWHSYASWLPPAAVPLANGAACVQAFRAGPTAWGIQFHAEVTGADFSAWIDHERSSEEVERLGLDADALRTRTAERIHAWNELGRGLCARFLDAATA